MLRFLDAYIVFALKNNYSEIKKHFMEAPSTSIVIPDIVLAEIAYSARKSKNYNMTIKIYDEFTNNFNTA